ncbi:hypothetical protein CP8484711_2078A, partial [Chlamydia psittaci 84-8471/1]
MKLRYQIP